MEALVALGLAANIAQFVSTAGMVVKRTYDLRLASKSLQEENEELEIIIRDFKLVLPIIRTATHPDHRDPTDASLTSLRERAEAISNEIETLLDTIKARRSKRGYSARILATIEELKLAEPLKALQERLTGVRAQIGIRINLVLLAQQTQIKNALNDHVKVSQIYKADIDLKLNEVTRLVESRIVGAGGYDDEAEAVRGSWKGTSEDLAAIAHALRTWRPHLLDFHKTELVLRSLYFSQVDERENSIADAHRETYQWIFDEKTTNWKSWLTTERAAIYWIAGNAGSGKSTLMKFIHQHPLMMDGIRSWAGHHTLYVASHFFWVAGTPMQQSQEGLFRSLLYQVILQRPQLIKHLFPSMWQASQNFSEFSRSLTWTTKELLEAFLRLPARLGEDYLFIFIDGLDEYNGDHEHLVKLLKTLGAAPNVKLCVSSRPWLDFSDAFSASPWKLYLQDLTREDISVFVRDSLEGHDPFRKLSARNRTAAEDLVTQITTKAQGVFLWVYLVVRSLMKGLTNADNIRDLQRRVDEMPQQLEEFFQRILDSIDPFYISRTAKIFLVLAHARSSISLLSFYFLEQEEDGLPFEPTTFLKKWPDVDEEELELITTKKRQLIAQCKDLIDVVELPNAPIMFNYTVTFLHRTIIDFINQPRILGHQFELAGGEFKPVVALFGINMGQFCSLHHLMHRTFLKPYLCNWLLASVYYAREIEVTYGTSQIKSLRPLDALIKQYLHSKHEVDCSFSKVLSILQQGHEDYFESVQNFAIQCGLTFQRDSGVLIETRGIAVQCPTVAVQNAGDFKIVSVISETDQDRANACPKNGVYNNTYEMITMEEAEKLRRRHQGVIGREITNEVSLPVTTARITGPQFENQVKPEGARQNELSKSRRKRWIRKLFSRQ